MGEDSTKKSKSQVLSDFLTANKKILIGIVVVAAVIVITFGVINNLNIKKQNEINNAVVELENLYSDVINEKSDVEELVELTNKLKADYKGSVAELTSHLVLAEYYFDNDDFEKSFGFYTEAYSNFPEDLGASTYMFNAAMALDELGRSAEAIELLEELVKKYKSDDAKVADLSSDIPETLFNLGRLYEDAGNREKAIESYEILVAEYQSYNLSNLAKSRLIDIK